MGKGKRYIYYVEGECEEKLINTLKEQNLLIHGKVEVFNVTQETISDLRLRLFSPSTIIILVFDTDVECSQILLDNIRILKKHESVQRVICVLQVNNLEDELVRATDVRRIIDILPCPSNKEFKHYLLDEKRLYDKLLMHSFDLDKIWAMESPKGYESIKNEGVMIKDRKH